MYGGIIYHEGTVLDVQGNHNGKVLTLKTGIENQVGLGDSVGVNGVCLTVTKNNGDSLCFDVWPETLKRTTLDNLTIDQSVHVDLPLKSGDFIGGHSILGHVDYMAEVLEYTEVPGSTQVKIWFTVPAQYDALLPARGCVSVDGVSLTITDRKADAFSVSLIPETLERTHLDAVTKGDKVNIEVDYNSRNFIDDTGFLSLRIPTANQVHAMEDKSEWIKTALEAGSPVIITEQNETLFQAAIVAPVEKLNAEVLTFCQGMARSSCTITVSHDVAEKLVIPAPIINNKDYDEDGRRYLVPINHLDNIDGDESAEATFKTLSLFTAEDKGPEHWKTPGNVSAIQIFPEFVEREYHGLPEASIHLMRENDYKDCSLFMLLRDAKGSFANEVQVQSFAERYQIPVINRQEIKAQGPLA